ncbi:MAG: methyltransferase domain-containing protein, partial [Ktedonobacteraceae bacterium]|nr:methyltransferase domain-containing protein [Ktedonobacteraceae bacterium]
MVQIKQAFDTALNKHYGCPKGVMGRIAGEVMVRQHRPETAWTLQLLDIQPADTVLEVGFGAGQGIKLAASKVNGGRVMGVDLSEAMVRAASKRNAAAVKAGRVVLSQGSITALPFEDQYFDKIMTIHTLYFWPEPHEPSLALSELCRVLKPGGRLVITLSTGKINARGEVEVWKPLQSALEEQ